MLRAVDEGRRPRRCFPAKLIGCITDNDCTEAGVLVSGIIISNDLHNGYANGEAVLLQILVYRTEPLAPRVLQLVLELVPTAAELSPVRVPLHPHIVVEKIFHVCMILVDDNVNARRVARLTIHTYLDHLTGTFVVVWSWNSNSRALIVRRFRWRGWNFRPGGRNLLRRLRRWGRRRGGPRRRRPGGPLRRWTWRRW